MKVLFRYATVLCLLATPAAFAEEVPAAVHALIPQLEKLGSDPVLTAAVGQHNAESLTLEEIQRRDADWRAVSGIDDFMQSLLDNDAARRLLEVENSQPYFTELFLMGNQGANVAMTNKTSDYWQGDEAKWQESFKDGSGAVHIGEVEFDESAQAYLVQVSVPVMQNGQTIGALTVGINLDELGE